MSRLFNSSVALVFLILAFLPMCIISVLIYLFMGSPVFFVQERVGIGGKFFKMYKFRTMSNLGTDVVDDHKRISAFGRLLRNTSLDELPELFNVMRGDMNLVGPRPLLPEYVSLYSAEQARRHEILPGITGWAQVNGRSSIGWEEKLALDVWYVDNRSAMLDLKILFATIFVVILRRNVHPDSPQSFFRFKGRR